MRRRGKGSSDQLVEAEARLEEEVEAAEVVVGDRLGV